MPYESAIPTSGPSLATAQEIRAAFLQLMQTSDLSFHAEYDAIFEFRIEGGDARSTLEQMVDVAGSDSHAIAQLTIEADGETDEFLAETVVVGGATYLKVGGDGTWSDVTADMGAGALPMPDNPFAGLDERRLTFMGMTDDGLYEFDINRWILGQMIQQFDPTSGVLTAGIGVGTFTNRVFVDETGTPHRLTSSFAFIEYVAQVPGEATLSMEFSRFGEPITIEKPLVNDEA